jgi:acetyltransferase-like isoleucine patch superfamily enzyme
MNFLEKLFRRIRWEKRSLLSRILALTFSSCGVRFNIGKDSVIVGAKYISIGKNFVGLDRNRLEAISRNGDAVFHPNITIGDNVIMCYDCHIGSINKIYIGNNVLMASSIYISDHDHGNTTFADMSLSPVKRQVISRGPVIIENDVWIGEKVSILSNVTIGHNSVIAANAVVTKSVPPYSVVAGVPARVIKSACPSS